MKATSRFLLSIVALALLPCLTPNVFGAHLAIAVPTPTTLDQLLVPGAYVPFDGGIALSQFSYTRTGDMPVASQINVTENTPNVLRFSGPFLDSPGGLGSPSSSDKIL